MALLELSIGLAAWTLAAGGAKRSDVLPTPRQGPFRRSPVVVLGGSLVRQPIR